MITTTTTPSISVEVALLKNTVAMLVNSVSTLSANVAILQNKVASTSNTVVSTIGIPGVNAISYASGVLTLTLANGSVANFTGIVTAAPPVLPAGVSPNSLPVVNVAPNTPYPNLATALLAVKDGGTVNIAAGTYQGIAHIDGGTFPSGLTVIGAGAYKTILDGQGGISGGHRLAWGKGIIHTNAPNTTIKGIGFINGGNAAPSSDGEAGAYCEATSGTFTVDSCAFNSNQDGIFIQNVTPYSVLNNNEFGLISPNGLADGMSHDIYGSSTYLVETNSRHYACVNGHGLKSRSINVSTSGNYYAHGGGRCVDLPDGTATLWTSNNDIFTDLPQSDTNIIGYCDETSKNGSAGGLISNATICISRYDTTILVGAGTLTFVNPNLSAYQITGTAGPNLVFQGNVIGLPPLPAPSGNGLTPPASILP